MSTAQASTAKQLSLLEDGMVLDVTMQNGQVIFSGLVKDFNGETLFLASPTDCSVPAITYGTELKLCCHSGEKTNVYHGVALGSKPTMWKIGELCDWYGWNRRSFYRQSLSIDARVLRVHRAHAQSKVNLDCRVDCRILDISGGGILFGCSQAVFEVDDRLEITQATLIPTEQPFSFVCTVKRTEKARFHNIYGCQFSGLSAKEEDRLVSTIFRLQAQERKRLSEMR